MDKLYCVDESAYNERTGARKRRWSLIGSKCAILKFLNKTKRWSVLPALIVNGYLPEPLIVQGSINKEVFPYRWLGSYRSGTPLSYILPGWNPRVCTHPNPEMAGVHAITPIQASRKSPPNRGTSITTSTLPTVTRPPLTNSPFSNLKCVLQLFLRRQ